MYTRTVPVIADQPFNNEHLLEELRRCKADRVALAFYRDLNHKFSSPEALTMAKERVDFFRKKGFGILIWIGETLGHNQVTTHPDGCETPYRRMKLPNKGTVDSFCPTDPRFVEDLKTWIRNIAALQPDIILLDDDYRMNGGCCCAAHVEWMNRVAGETLTAEEWIQNAFGGKPNHYRKIWMQVQGETLESLAKALREAVDEVSPSVRLGLCATHFLWDADGTDAEKIVKILAGNTKPFLRIFGAPYHSYHSLSRTLGESVELERLQFAWSCNWNIERISEGDTYPRPRFYCSAAHLECFDQILLADGTSDGILKYTADYCSDTFYERGYADAWERNLPLYEEIQALFADKEAVGLRPWHAVHLLEDADLTKTDPKTFNILQYSGGSYHPSRSLATENNLPTTYTGRGVNILTGEDARQIPLSDLEEGCILDLTAAKILQQRGVDVGIAPSEKETELTVSYLGGATQYFIEEGESVRMSGAVPPEKISLKPGAELLSEFLFGDVRLPGWFRYKNCNGQRFLVFPVEIRTLMGRDAKTAGYLNGYTLRRMLIEQIEWLNAPLIAYAEGNHPRLYTLTKKNDTALAVGLWNLFEDKIHNLTVHINGDYKNIRFVNCTGEKTATGVRITSTLYPYEFAGIELSQ